jgi:mannosyl-3-phosphoglycerate phosphatase family protein
MTAKVKTQWLVITDLDGSLLNHHNYAMDAAIPAIRLLQKKNIPIIFNTSKTFAESTALQQALQINAPFIVENGSAIYLPCSRFTESIVSETRFTEAHQLIRRDDYWCIQLGKSQTEIRQILDKLALPENSYQLLSECSVQQVMQLTALDEADAQQAMHRDYSEPLLWLADETQRGAFEQMLEAHGLNSLQGGRFMHVLGNCDKGRASQQLKCLYTSSNTTVKTIVLGDSPNDAAMLSMADISVMINSPSNKALQTLLVPNIRTRQEAPEGWAEAIEKALLKIPRHEAPL